MSGKISFNIYFMVGQPTVPDLPSSLKNIQMPDVQSTREESKRVRAIKP